MKFMKLGSKPDLFKAEGNTVRYVASELPPDVFVNVGEVQFRLHKFPLLSKIKKLRKLVLEESGETSDEIYLYNFPGGSKAFETCTKFCYGITITLNAYNVVAVRCAAEHLEMTEDIERGNLISKIEVFISSSVLRGWKDSIIVLQTTGCLLPWSEDLNIVRRCIYSISTKISVDHCNVNWSYTYNKKSSVSDEIVEYGLMLQQKMLSVIPKDWWVEDICDLDIDHYKRVMVAVKDKEVVSADAMVEALKAYAVRWLPNSSEPLVSDEYLRKNRYLVETIIWLMPSDMGSNHSCSFLLKLLKVVMLIEAEDKVKEELLNRISMQLDKASVKDLLIPAKSPCNTIYDVHLAQTLVKRFMTPDGNVVDSDSIAKDQKIADHFVLGRSSMLSIGKLVDIYLAEISADPNLPLSSFIEFSRSIPEAARPVHDGLYMAIDIYLKEHPGLTKAEKKTICSLMDVKKLSADASAHAAQNERLPLRVVVQVLYVEQVRTAGGGMAVPCLHGGAQSALKVEEAWERPGPEHCESINKQLKSLPISKNVCRGTEEKKASNNSENRGNGLLLPSRSRRSIFGKLWGAWMAVPVSAGTGTGSVPDWF